MFDKPRNATLINKKDGTRTPVKVWNLTEKYADIDVTDRCDRPYHNGYGPKGDIYLERHARDSAEEAIVL